MHPASDPTFFIPSGLNDRFYGDGLSFTDYIQQTRNMIKKARVDLTSDNEEIILSANSPSQWLPEQTQHTGKKYRRGILLLHGLTDSPYSIMDMGHRISTLNFAVRSVLLPGHGTVPADLLHIQHEEWIKAAKYGFEELKKIVDEIFVLGFSTGGTLAINLALDYPEIAGLVLVAPAIKLHRIVNLIQFYQPLNWFIPSLQWVNKIPQKDYAKYESFTFNAADQIYRTIKELHQKLETRSLHMPLFITVSADDELVSSRGTLDFFEKYVHPRNQMLIYGDSIKSSRNYLDVQNRHSQFPDQKILDFSHACLSVCPDNPQYGIKRDYQDFSHYRHGEPPSNENILLGAPTRKNLKKHIIERLRYNPDFNGMMEKVMAFLEGG